MERSESIVKLSEALAASHTELENASKSSTNPFFNSKYADLAEILNTVRAIFAKNGLSIVQFPDYTGEGFVTVETVLTHKSGEFMLGTTTIPVAGKKAQDIGSAITYCRRYALSAVCSVAQEDDDGNDATKGQPVEKITENQAADLAAMIEEKGLEAKPLLGYYKIQKLEDLPAEKHSHAVEQIEKAAQKKAEAEADKKGSGGDS